MSNSSLETSPKTTMAPLTNDTEKGQNSKVDDANHRASHVDPTSISENRQGLGKFGEYLTALERKLVRYNLEARGVQRVEEHDSHALSWKKYVQAFLLWFSVNLVAVSTSLGMLAPTVFELSFKDSVLCAVFGSLLGGLGPAYIATWGPISGNRTMIITRYTFGWWPSKLIVVLNLIVLLGYCLLDVVVAGQILNAVSSNGSLPVVVGIIIVALISWLIATFGIQVFNVYMRYAWFPQLIAFSILYGVSSSKYNLEIPSQGDPRTIAGNRLSFFSLNFSAAITYAGGAADFFVYYSPKTPRLPLFAIILLGLVLSFTFALTAGIGLASAIPTNTKYAAAYDHGAGNLIVEGFSTLNGFGKFLGVVIALGLISNVIFPTYAAGIDFQILGEFATKIPRAIWNSFGAVIYTVCALAGRSHLSRIFTNFLALMGYWASIWIVILIEEDLVFRRRRGYNWTDWNRRERLPLGIAAFVAFLVGWAGAILCMAQVWYIGPIAKLVGEYGADMGNYVSLSWALIVYPPLRWLELKKFGR